MITTPAVRRRLFRTFMSLPPPVLRLLSGGAGVHHEGRTLDPRLQYLGGLAGDEADAGLGLPDADPGVLRERLTIETPLGPQAVTVLRPLRQAIDLPVLVFATAGGGLAGHVGGCETLCAMIARTARSVVICFDPGAARLEETTAQLREIYRWVRQNAAQFGAPQGDAAIGGAALGAAAVTAVTRALRTAGEPQPALQLLLSPQLDDDPADSIADEAGGLAPAVIATTGFDPASVAAEAYARNLRAAGVSCHFRRYDTLTAGFVAFTGVVPAAARAAREIAVLTAGALQSRYAPPDTLVPPLHAPVAETPAVVDRTEAFN